MCEFILSGLSTFSFFNFSWSVDGGRVHFILGISGSVVVEDPVLENILNISPSKQDECIGL